jgi:hypothetical protein
LLGLAYYLYWRHASAPAGASQPFRAIILSPVEDVQNTTLGVRYGFFNLPIAGSALAPPHCHT